VLKGLFDTHAHYDAEQFDQDRDAVLAALPGEGVALVVDPGCDLPSSRKAVELAGKYPFLYAAVGLHPEECAGYCESDLDAIRALAQAPKVVAIGEIGLDYYWPENPARETQQKVFRDQLALAQELDLPVIVHDREAHGDSLAIVKEFPKVRGVFHCFAGSAEMAGELVRLGWMISFTGVLTYKNARKSIEAAAAVPLERLMIETDSPYMAPVPNRGKRNDSRNLTYICEKLAEIKGVTPQQCADATRENGKKFFGIPKENLA
jgi:TatD DNase family protein